MTPEVTIRCPKCKSPSHFSFVSLVKIKTKDAPYFAQSKNFKLFKGQQSSGSYYSAALYFHGIGNSLDNINDLPHGYHSEMWRHKNWYVSLPDELKNKGSYRCIKCPASKKHEISWPQDAYFQVNYQEQTLWAYDRKTAVKLLDYIESHDRQKCVIGYSGDNPHNLIVSQDWFLRKIPGHFQTAKARSEISKKLRKILT